MNDSHQSASVTVTSAGAVTNHRRWGWVLIALAIVSGVWCGIQGCRVQPAGPEWPGEASSAAGVRRYADTGYYVSGVMNLPRVLVEDGVPSEASVRGDIGVDDVRPAANYVVYLPRCPEIYTLTASDGSYRLGPIPEEAKEDLSDLGLPDFDLFTDPGPASIATPFPRGSALPVFSSKSSEQPGQRRAYMAPLLDELRAIEQRLGRRVLDKMTFPVVKPSVRIKAVPLSAFRGRVSLADPGAIPAAIRAGWFQDFAEGFVKAAKETPVIGDVVAAVESVVEAFRGNFEGYIDIGLPNVDRANLMKKLGDAVLTPVVMEPANRQVRGIILDELERPMPNLTLAIMDESFTTDWRGEFISPMMARNTLAQIEVPFQILRPLYAQKLPRIKFSFPASEKPYYRYQIFPKGWKDRPPLVSVTPASYRVNPGASLRCEGTARDPDNKPVTLSWSATHGSIRGTGLQVNFVASPTDGLATITLEARDPGGNIGRASVNVYVVGEVNNLAQDDPYAFAVVPDVGQTPANNAVDVIPFVPLTLTFNKNVAVRPQTITLYNETTGAVVATFSSTDPARVAVNGNVVTLSPPLGIRTRYSLAIPNGTFWSTDFKQYWGGIPSRGGWVFTTFDPISGFLPEVSGPGRNSYVGRTQAVRIIFNTDVRLGTGSFIIRDATTNAILERIPATDARVQIPRNREVQLGHAPFPVNGKVVIQFEANAVLAASGHPLGALLDNSWYLEVSPSAAVTHVRVDTPAAGSGVTVGDEVRIKVFFSRDVYFDGTFELELNTTPTRRRATYSGAAWNSITFRYIVQTGDTAAVLDYVGVDSFKVIRGQITDRQTGDPAVLTLPAPGSDGSLAASRIAIESVPPRVVNVTSPMPNGRYYPGDTIDVHVQFSTPVKVTGTPVLYLTPGQLIARYVSGTGSSTLVFRYVIQQGITSSDLDYSRANTPLVLENGAAIRSLAGTPINREFPAPGGPGSLAANRDLVIRPTGPTLLTQAPTSPEHNRYLATRNTPVVVAFSEPLYPTSSGTISVVHYNTQQVIATLTVADTSRLAVSGSQMTLSNLELEWGAGYYLVFSPNVFRGVPALNTANTYLFYAPWQPSVDAFNSIPPTGATFAARLGPITMAMSQAPQAGATGSIFIKRYNDDVTVQTLSVTDGSRVRISGKNVVLTIDPLSPAVQYYVTFTDGCFLGFRVPLKGIWVFTTAPEFTFLAASPTTPLPGATGVSRTANMVLGFAGAGWINQGTGLVQIKRYSDNSVLWSNPANRFGYVNAGILEVLLSNISLPPNTRCYVTVDANCFPGFAGITSKDTWSFTTAPLPTFVTTAPTSPLPGATGVSRTAPLVMAFSTNVLASTGTIAIKRYSDDATVESFAANNTAKVTVSGAQATLNIAPLAVGTKYYVSVPNTCFVDFAGLASKDTWSFTTAPAATFVTGAPTSPSPGATEVSVAAPLVMGFTTTVTAGNGTITIKKYDDDTTIETFAANNPAKVTVSGTQATLHIAQLSTNTQYYVVVDGAAFIDFAGLSSKDDWSFTTIAALPAVVTTATVSPGDGAIEVDPNKTLVVPLSTALDPATVNATNVQVTSGGNPVAGDVQYHTATTSITFVPNPSFPINSTVTCTLTSAIKKENGDPIAPYSFSFTTLNTADLTAWWRFEGNTDDSSPNGHTLTAIGSPVITTARAKMGASSAQFDGSSRYSINGGAAFDLGDKFTISAWVFVPTGLTASMKTIVANGLAGGEEQNGFKFCINTWGNLDRRIMIEAGTGNSPNGGKLRTAADLILENNWYHLAFSIDKTTKEWKVYYNGTDVPWTFTSDQGFTEPNFDAVVRNGVGTNQATAIGAFLDGQYGFTGNIDDLRIYRKVLTPAQIQKISEER